MDRSFTFTLTQQEYLDYLRCRTGASRGHRGKRLWLLTSVPMLIVVSLIFFRLYKQPFVMALALMLIVIWVLVLAPDIWQRFVAGRIGEKLLERAGVRGFSEVTVRFGGRTLWCTGLGDIPYRAVEAFVPLQSVFAFDSGDGRTVLLPTRLFTGEEDMKQFIRLFETVWAREWEAAGQA